MNKRRAAKVVRVGNIYIGGNHAVSIQSMVKFKTSFIGKTARQINELEGCGCEIARLAIKDISDARALKQIKRETRIPLVADIHFDWRLAIAAIESGADKLRLNPGNIYKKNEIKEIVSALKMAHIPLRIGLNSGSVKNTGSHMDMAERLTRGALDYIRQIEKFKFTDIVVSLKGSTVLDTLAAYRKLAKACDYPFHLGVTATGLPREGVIKSAIAIGALLSEGIGDTIRVSLTAKPEEEVRAAQAILEAVGLRRFKPEIISCPTCGRCEVDLVGIVKKIEHALLSYPVIQLSSYPVIRLNGHTGKPPKVAIMGCVVNGPGEAKEADIGIAFGKKDGLLFKRGLAIKKIPVDRCVDVLLEELHA